MATSIHFEPFSKQLTIIVGLTVVGFMAFGLALSFYRNILFEQRLEEINKQNEALKGRIENGYHMLEYYQSTQYKEKYAKQNLDKVNPGEKVLILTQKQKAVRFDDEDVFEPSEQEEATYLEFLRQMPTIEHWKLYLFHPERIEQMKRAL